MTSVPTGIDLQRFYPQNKQQAREREFEAPNKPTLGIVATMRVWKGQLNAWSKHGNHYISSFLIGN